MIRPPSQGTACQDSGLSGRHPSAYHPQSLGDRIPAGETGREGRTDDGAPGTMTHGCLESQDASCPETRGNQIIHRTKCPSAGGAEDHRPHTSTPPAASRPPDSRVRAAPVTMHQYGQQTSGAVPLRETQNRTSLAAQALPPNRAPRLRGFRAAVSRFGCSCTVVCFLSAFTSAKKEVKGGQTAPMMLSRSETLCLLTLQGSGPFQLRLRLQNNCC